MKLRNKKTGEIAVFGEGIVDLRQIGCENVAEMIEKGWEDYQESEASTRITGPVEKDDNTVLVEFYTHEEAEKAVEKLKAKMRLQKCGFKFEGYEDRDRAKGGDIVIYAHVDIPHNNLLEEAQPDMLKDLDLLFGGKE